MRAWRAWRGEAPKWRLFIGREHSPPGCFNRAPAFCSRRFSAVAQKTEKENEEFSTLCKLVKTTPNAFEALKKWTSEGNKLSPQVFTELSAWMATRSSIQALKMMAAVREEKLTEMTVEQSALEISLSCRQSRCPRAEQLYTSLPEEMKADERVKASLLSGLAKAREIAKLENWMKTLTVVDAEAWSRILESYLHRHRHDKVLESYRKMKEAGVELNVESCWALLKCKDQVGGLEGIEKDAEECLEKFDLTNRSFRSLKRLLECYGYLKKPEAVEKVWNFVKSWLEDRDEGFYGSVIRAFGLAGDLSRAEKVLEEFVSRNDNNNNNNNNNSSSNEFKKLPGYPYVDMIEVYARLGFMEKAEEMLKDKIKLEPNDSNFLPFDHIIQGYIAKNETSSALETYLEAVNDRCKMQYKTVEGLLKIFESKEDARAANKMFHQHYHVGHGDTKLYNQLLKVYVAAGKTPTDFRKKMHDGHVDADEETEKLLISLSSPAKETVESTEDS